MLLQLQLLFCVRCINSWIAKVVNVLFWFLCILISSRRFLSLQECPKWHNPSPQNRPSKYNSPPVHNAEWSHAGAAFVHDRKHLLLSDQGTTDQRGQAISFSSLLFQSFSARGGEYCYRSVSPHCLFRLPCGSYSGQQGSFSLCNKMHWLQQGQTKDPVIMHLLNCRFSTSPQLHWFPSDSVAEHQFHKCLVIKSKADQFTET